MSTAAAERLLLGVRDASTEWLNIDKIMSRRRWLKGSCKVLKYRERERGQQDLPHRVEGKSSDSVCRSSNYVPVKSVSHSRPILTIWKGFWALYRVMG